MNRICKILKLFRGCLVLSLLMLLTVGARASGTGKLIKVGRFDVGFRTGLSIAGVGGADGDLYEKNRTGLFAGGFARFCVSNVVSLETNVSYVKQGARGEILVTDYKTNEVYPADEVMVLDRVVVVPAIVFSLPIEGKIRPSLLAGVAVAFAGSSKIEIEGFDAVDISQYTQSTTVGFLLGAELAYHRESTRMFVDVRYSRDSGDFFEPESFEWIGQVISIGVGIGFKL